MTTHRDDPNILWTRGEKGRFYGLGVDLFHDRRRPETRAERIVDERRARCTWCGHPLDDCIKGLPSTCGFGVEP